MADNRVQVDLVAENAQLKAKLAESEALLANVGKKGGKEAAGGLDDVSKSASALSKVMRLITIPAVAITAAYNISKFLLDSTEHAKRFREELRGIGSGLAGVARDGALKLRLGEFSLDVQNLRDRARDAEAKVREELSAKLNSVPVTLSPAFLVAAGGDPAKAETIRRLLGLDSATLEQAKKDAEAELGRIKASLETALKNAEEVQFERRRDQLIALHTEAELDGETKLFYEFQRRRNAIIREFRDTQDKEEIAARQRQLDLLNTIEVQAGEKLRDAKLRQIREIIDEQKKAQSDGFTIKDLNTTNIGSGSALQIIGQQLPSLVTLAGGGR